jgi:hypothetical protein
VILMTKASDKLEAAGLEPDEAAATAVPEQDQDPRTPEMVAELTSANPVVGMRTDSNANRVAQDFLHLTSPSGTDVVFTPGEALPEWARKIQAERMTMPNLADEALYGSRPAAPKAQKSIRTQVKKPGEVS